jgi:hypothetical protein
MASILKYDLVAVARPARLRLMPLALYTELNWKKSLKISFCFGPFYQTHFQC